jgi:hypothetical protein
MHKQHNATQRAYAILQNVCANVVCVCYTCLTCLSGFIPALLSPRNNDSFCTSNVLQLLLSNGVTYSVTVSNAVNTADSSTGNL